MRSPMKKHCLLIALAACAAAPALAQNVGVSIGINQPGAYGRVDIGNSSPPPVVYSQPVLVTPGYYARQRQPVYLYVPPEHSHHWARYCGQYGACGQPVYFVQEQWVRERYDEAHHRGRDRHEGWRNQRDDRHQGRRDERDDGHDRGRHEGWRER